MRVRTGPGAIGGWMGVKLARAGHTVSVLARGATLAAIRADGLRLIEAGETAAVKVAASDDPAELIAEHFPDLLIVAIVKSQGPARRWPAARPLIGPNTMVLTGDERRAVVVLPAQRPAAVRYGARQHRPDRRDRGEHRVAQRCQPRSARRLLGRRAGPDPAQDGQTA